MSIISRYLIKEFFKPLLFIVVVFVGLYIVAQLVDEMRSYVSHHPPASMIIFYYLYRIPYFAVQVMPLAVLLSALLSLGQLARHNELIALRGCGFSFAQVAAPILTAAALIVAGVIAFDELVIPLTNPRADFIKKVKIEKNADQSYLYQRERVTRSVSGQRIIYMRRLDALAGRMEGAILLDIGPDLNLRRRIDAPQARWQDGRWVFENGWLREFDAEGNISAFQSFHELAVAIKESPRDFIREEKDSHQLLSMSMRDLQHRIRLLKEMGTPSSQEEVNYHLKLAFPFANFILALLGVALPFIFPSGRRALVGAAIGFVITLVAGFFYIGFIAVGTSLGNNGTLSPVISVWLANIIFLAIGIWLMRKAA